jgi:hypothetical protein
MEQLVPTASVVPQAFAPVVMVKSVGLVPVMLMPVMFSVAVPVFVIVAEIDSVLRDREASVPEEAPDAPTVDDILTRMSAYMDSVTLKRSRSTRLWPTGWPSMMRLEGTEFIQAIFWSRTAIWVSSTAL